MKLNKKIIVNVLLCMFSAIAFILLCIFVYKKMKQNKLMPIVNKDELKFEQNLLNLLQISINLMCLLPETRNRIKDPAFNGRDLIKIMLKIFNHNRICVTKEIYQEIRENFFSGDKYEDYTLSYPYMRIRTIFMNFFEMCFSDEKYSEIKNKEFISYFYTRIEATLFSPRLNVLVETIVENNGQMIIASLVENKLIFNQNLIRIEEDQVFKAFEIKIFPIFLFVTTKKRKDIKEIYKKIQEDEKKEYITEFEGKKYKFVGNIIEKYQNSNTIYFEVNNKITYKLMNNLLRISSIKAINEIIDEDEYIHTIIFRKIE